jgi:hypothetical protein
MSIKLPRDKCNSSSDPIATWFVAAVVIITTQKIRHSKAKPPEPLATAEPALETKEP